MPLDNNAKISDIINSLEDMQGINQKAELASVIGAPATASDNIATQITKLQGAKDTFADKIGVDNTTPLQAMADVLEIGKSVKIGSVFMPNSNAITVTDIPFKPSVIVLRTSNNMGNVGTFMNDGTTWVSNYTGGGGQVHPSKPILTGNTYSFNIQALTTNVSNITVEYFAYSY